MGFFNTKKEEKQSKDNKLPELPSLEKVETHNSEKLSPPPIPGGSNLEDIKNQVVNSKENLDKEKEVENTNSGESKENLPNEEIDSLFDLSNVDFPTESKETSVKDNLNNSNLVNTKNSIEIHNSNNNIDDNNMDLNLDFTRNLSLNNKKMDENIFVTTAQFKKLLNIIDSVKSKVKSASETHMRLMDIKSEEDIEYENLKKSFQYIEDKLYEVDNLIFEK